MKLFYDNKIYIYNYILLRVLKVRGLEIPPTIFMELEKNNKRLREERSQAEDSEKKSDSYSDELEDKYSVLVFSEKDSVDFLTSLDRYILDFREYKDLTRDQANSLLIFTEEIQRKRRDKYEYEFESKPESEQKKLLEREIDLRSIEIEGLTNWVRFHQFEDKPNNRKK